MFILQKYNFQNYSTDNFFPIWTEKASSINGFINTLYDSTT